MYNYNLTDVPIVDESITTTPLEDSEDCCNKETPLNVKHILSQLSEINQKLGNIEVSTLQAKNLNIFLLRKLSYSHARVDIHNDILQLKRNQNDSPSVNKLNIY